jgi:hypothetical protein
MEDRYRTAAFALLNASANLILVSLAFVANLGLRVRAPVVLLGVALLAVWLTIAHYTITEYP